MNKARTSTPWKVGRQIMIINKHQSRKWRTLHKQLRNLIKEREEIKDEAKQIKQRLKVLFSSPDDELDCD